MAAPAAGARLRNGEGVRKPVFLPDEQDAADLQARVRIIDVRNFPVATTIAAAHVTVMPGGLRELHWHQTPKSGSTTSQGRGRMTVFFNGGKACTADFNPGDVGVVPRTFGHYIENTGDTDLIFLGMFKAPRFMDLSLSEWVANTPPELVMQHLGIREETLKAVPKPKQVVVGE